MSSNALHFRDTSTLPPELAIIERDPDILHVEDVYYAPHRLPDDRASDTWGIFHKDNVIVDCCVERWLPALLPLRHSGASTIRPSDITHSLPDRYEYLYGGRYDFHFGHFIIETLARLWPLAEAGLRPDQKIVMHGDGDPGLWFSTPYVREFLSALQIEPDRIVHSQEPFRIPRLTVPLPSYRPQALAHKAFSRLCLAIGRKLVGEAEEVRLERRPIYLAKTRLTSGVSGLVHEDRVVSILERAGIEIAFPETLTIRDQIQLLQSRTVVSGWCTSNHHLSLFTGRCAKFDLLAPHEMNSNFIIIDKLVGNHSNYWTPADLTLVKEAGHPFVNQFILDNPDGIAEALIEQLTRRSEEPPRSG